MNTKLKFIFLFPVFTLSLFSCSSIRDDFEQFFTNENFLVKCSRQTSNEISFKIESSEVSGDILFKDFDFSSLKGKKQELAVRNSYPRYYLLIGNPNIKRGFWMTYSTDSCALKIYKYSETNTTKFVYSVTRESINSLLMNASFSNDSIECFNS